MSGTYLLGLAGTVILIVCLKIPQRMPGRRLEARVRVSQRLRGQQRVRVHCRTKTLPRDEVIWLAACHGYRMVSERPGSTGTVVYGFERVAPPAPGVAWWGV
ncbi:hypothetical protein ACU686_02275 [Yinghuangia aomiensis]